MDNRDVAERSLDPEATAWAEAFELWWTGFESRPVGVSELFGKLGNSPDLLLALNLGDRSPQSQKTQLGLKLKHRRDRLSRGRRLEQVGTSHGAVQWRLVQVDR